MTKFTDTNKYKNVDKRFDEKFHYENGKWVYRYFSPSDQANGCAQPENFKSFLHQELDSAYKKGYTDALDDDFEEQETRADIAIKNYAQGFHDARNGRKQAPHDTRDGWCCACSYDLSVIEEKIKQAKEEMVTKIKKSLPTHKGKMLSRTEVKKVLDSLNNET